MSKKRCFVIAPIGEDGSATRKRSDQILHHLLRPVAAEFDFAVTRADDIPDPGIITSQIIERLIEDPLVIADLTGRNPNVYYELAVRQATGNPVIQIIEKGEALPFDVASTRVIIIDHKDLDSVESARCSLRGQISSVLNSKAEISESPISLAFNLRNLRRSRDPQQSSLADVVERMTSVQGAVLSIQDKVGSRLERRLDKLFVLMSSINVQSSTTEQTQLASNLNESLENIRVKLLSAVNGIIDDIRVELLKLAEEVQSTFDEQSETAAEAVYKDFRPIIEEIVEDSDARENIINRLMETFMVGMNAMGQYQNLNITKHTELSADRIRSGIKTSIEDVFKGIDDLEEQIIALPSS